MSAASILYMDVKRLAIHDGPGIRTTLFLKGCPLRCRWCHNPEGLTERPQVAFYASRCLVCGTCAAVCPTGAHAFSDGARYWNKALCKGCGACESACPGEALKQYGREIGIERAFELLTEDRAFYAPGGATLSGGEPLLQAEACAALLHKLKDAGVHTAVDTCGAVPWAAFEKVLPYTDLFLYDVKHINSEKHRALTGRGNEQILDNLKKLSDCGAAIEIRMPIIPGLNDDERTMQAAGRFLAARNVRRVVLLPYHALAASKYEALGMRCDMGDTASPDRERMARLVAEMKRFGLNAVSPALDSARGSGE